MKQAPRRISLAHDQDEARRKPRTNFVVNSRFKEFAVRDGNLITGQQQYSGVAAARLI
jgi:putative intracellular protease/amidase